MEIQVIKSEKDYVEVELKGGEYGLANALKEILLEDKDVEFAAARLDHPVAANPVLMVRTTGASPLPAIKSALRKLKRMAASFKEAVGDAKKPKK